MKMSYLGDFTATHAAQPGQHDVGTYASHGGGDVPVCCLGEEKPLRALARGRDGADAKGNHIK